MRTLLMIKPDTVAEGRVGNIIALAERNGFTITRLSVERFTRERAERFYAVHRERPFFPDLVDYISGGDVVAIELEAEDAVRRLRELVGATNPAESKPGTIRYLYGKSLQNNAVHASDSPESAKNELAIAFGGS